jgi:hypothetical protein
MISSLTCEERESFMIESDSPYDKLKDVLAIAKYSKTPSHNDIPVVPLGSHQPT